MNFWESFGIAFIPAIVAALISGIISFVCAKMQNKTEIEKIEKEHKEELNAYKSRTMYDLKKEAILSALAVIDTYLSWLTFSNSQEKSIRETTTPLQLTLETRKCFNNLSLTCKSEKLINLFSDTLFKEDGNALKYYEDFRNEARKELELNEISFNKEIIFLSRVTTLDLHEATKIETP